MDFLIRPSRARVDAYLTGREGLPPNYDGVGQTRGETPAGYWRNHHRCRIGRGEDTFLRARAALQGWEMFDLDWLELCWPERPVREGAVVATLARVLGVWTLNPCRVIYVADAPDRFEFGYGTVDGHAMRGEERFTVSWDRDGDDGVEYEVLSFSRPGTLRSGVALPLVRRLQRRFVQDSARRMTRGSAR